jgi:hypothetical protein
MTLTQTVPLDQGVDDILTSIERFCVYNAPRSNRVLVNF